MITRRWVVNWLFLGAVLVFIQVFIGGVTRLTESGLSITEWDIIMGTFPPLTEESWLIEFEKYKDTPQYVKLNQGMSLSEFKFIYFWEYFHRLWARMMGFVFLIPFLVFLFLGKLRKQLLWKLLFMFLGAAVVAAFGWIMVSTGLKDRPWVSAYSLSMHLGLALTLYSYILYVWASERWREKEWTITGLGGNGIVVLLILLIIQIILGAWMSGMKAGLYYPDWPDYSGSWIPEPLLIGENWQWKNVVSYDNETGFMIALVQFLHRNTAYILTLFIAWWSILNIPRARGRWTRVLTWMVPLVCVVQVLLGILTLINCVGHIPVGLGSAHQVVAILLLSVVVLLLFSVNKDRNKKRII